MERKEPSLQKRPARTVAEMKTQQASKIRQIGEALVAAGLCALDEQAEALGLSRSTTWSILKASYKNSGLTPVTLKRMLAAPDLPPIVRAKILEYIEEKTAGLYGDGKTRLRKFTAALHSSTSTKHHQQGRGKLPLRPRIKYVIAPPLTIADLPPPSTKRWVIRRKAVVVAAVRNGLLSLNEACSRYTLTADEFLSWQSTIDQHGPAGLGHEIRRRLHVSFGVEEQPRDDLTELLCHLIGQIALILSPDEPWWANRDAFDILKNSINDLLLELLPYIDAGREPQPGTTSKLQDRYGSDLKPEIIARILARAVFVEHAKEALERTFGDNKKG